MRLNKIRFGAIAAAAALALGGLSACGGDDGGGSGDTLNIGFMGDLSGPDSAIVIPPRQGAQLAIDQYNATNPPKKIKLIPYDTQGKEEQAAQLAPKAIKDDKIVAMIGPAFSGESLAVDALLEQGKVANITPSATNPDLSKKGWKFWHRLVATDAAQGAQVAEAMIKAKSPKTAYVINGKKPYSVGIGDHAFNAFKAKGVNVQRDQIDETAPDYSSTVTKVKSANPDVIFYGGYYSEGGKLLKQLRDGGVTALWASGDGSLDAKLVEGAGAKQAENAVLACPCFIPFGEQTDATLVKFVADYKAKNNNTAPAIYSTEGYDAATALVSAIKAGNVTGEKINEFLKTYDVKGVSKQVKWGPDGELATTTIHLYQVQGGSIKWLGTADQAQLKG
ncbi:branched-chain amino acid ABC transporter substrate-binding protein [Thermomonospora umbrina]|uniref:Amino acid/amide ABC transporter substrate-binding protein (HAAT family) n=1 Tax=Thermomonospora umbrina TaxID=111806 RepID=A0A3D9T0C0_9ACTN|nr:branched-chain amino acid ABC transporter substrate-binding protein [Thermomonospora umbrina]REE99773.1 amino acid/amide ABC transporter substrate-binding protein (HAAT family) [Thermomonospora umbrina]